MDYFVFNGIDSRNYSAYVFDAGTDRSPIYQYDAQEIPGRNGDLLINTNRRPNVTHEYNVLIVDSFSTNFPLLVNALLSVNGYARLTDSIHTSEYYMAYFSEAIEPTLSRNRDAGKFRAVFQRKPQRFLVSGETAQDFTASGSISNPTLYASAPLLRVYGTGDVGIGGYSFTVSLADGYTDIDCDIMECYKDTSAVNCNGNVSFTDYEFPKLKGGTPYATTVEGVTTVGVTPGVSAISLGTGITKVTVTPRWYQL